MQENFEPAQLILETGEQFSGFSPPWQDNLSFGEVVFNTGMTGYVESLTDPSYAGQILVFTYPLIGNYGVSSPSSWESLKIHCRGIVMSELAQHYSNHEAVESLQQWLSREKIPLLINADTRAITKRLRMKGVIPGAIVKINPSEPLPALKFENFADKKWIASVSLEQPVEYISPLLKDKKQQSSALKIIAVDCGMKENILRNLLKFPIIVKRVPYNYDYTNETVDGIFISNGPGDPIHCTETVEILKKAMSQKKVIFGICLGTQLMALACGAKTYKLHFGHRSHNQPCIHLESQRCYLTSQNHSYAIDEKTLPRDWKVSFRNLNDQSIEGIAHTTLPFFSVQFHPESAPGPLDTEWLFDDFYQLILAHKQETSHAS